MTPTIAANNKAQKFSARAKAIPLKTMRPEPASSTRRRPTRSATSVSSVPSSTSPSSVSVMKSPIW